MRSGKLCHSLVLFILVASLPALAPAVLHAADGELTQAQRNSARPQPWPGGLIPYDITQLTSEQQAKVLRAMKRWTDTSANLQFIPRTNQLEYVFFTGKTDAGNNTSHTGFSRGQCSEVNITAFWWRQNEWMIAHELGHVLGFHHEHQRWDRDDHVKIHFENIKPGRAHDYEAIPKNAWLVTNTSYDYRSIMHYRVCWAAACESECRDADGKSSCAVIEPLAPGNDKIIGQWDANGISAIDAEEVRLIYGIKPAADAKLKVAPPQAR